jgi:hypothetical protein
VPYKANKVQFEALNRREPPNKALQPTPLCGEQDRGVFERWNRLDSFSNLWVRRG